MSLKIEQWINKSSKHVNENTYNKVVEETISLNKQIEIIVSRMIDQKNLLSGNDEENFINDLKQDIITTIEKQFNKP